MDYGRASDMHFTWFSDPTTGIQGQSGVKSLLRAGIVDRVYSVIIVSSKAWDVTDCMHAYDHDQARLTG